MQGGGGVPNENNRKKVSEDVNLQRTCMAIQGTTEAVL